MTMYLTRKQKEMLEFLGNFVRENGFSPSLDEIAKGLGLSSLATVHKHLKNLEAKGLVRRRWNHSRSLELTRSALGLVQASAATAVELPLLGRIAAGCPIEAIRDEEAVAVPAEMLGRGRTYLLRVQGDSMVDGHICDGDLVVVEERREAENGETVIALIRGEETTLKKFYRETDHIRLQPANDAMEPIRVEPDELEIQGVVVGVMRKY